MGLRHDGATSLPSGLASGATWNPDLVEAGGAMIGSEARAKGFNVMLAGGVNLLRDPRNGRSFEYVSEDPLLSGEIAGAAIRGIQSNQIISTAKHFALNDQETGRHFLDVKIGEAAARESDLLAFEIAIEKGRPGSVMCAYEQVHGSYACDNDWLLNKVLKTDWGYKGYVMSDWGAVPALTAALNGLDQQSGEQLDPKVFFSKDLADTASKDPAYAKRLDDMNRRILWALYSTGAVQPHPKGAIDFAADRAKAQTVEEEGAVLLRNQAGALPLTGAAKTILVVGGYADSGVLAGSGSSLVHAEGGPAATVSYGGDGPFAALANETYQKGAPLAAIKALAGPNTTVKFRTGRYVSEALAEAKKADVVIVFGTQWLTEGFDAADLHLPFNQDLTIGALAKANPHTIVVLETGSAIAMPWFNDTAAVLEAWYPGAGGAGAIANILFGKVNPSGRLPLTFPASEDQLPRPEVPGFHETEPDFGGRGKPGAAITADYDIEGSDVGYRWFAREGKSPALPFGFGLSYTSFSQGPVKVAAGKSLTASVEVTNTGGRAGAEVVQVYMTSQAGKKTLRLAGFQKVSLQPGEKKTVTVTLEPRVIANWSGKGWTVAKGAYQFAAGESAADLGPAATVTLKAQSLAP
jgi:beta-glucosidase